MLRITLYLLLIAILMASCIQDSQAPGVPASINSESEDHFLVTSQGDTIRTGVPIRVEGKRIDPDSVAPPKVVPIRSEPKVIPAQKKVRMAGKPKVVPVPKELTIIVPGKDGVPLPDTVPAEGKVVPTRQPRPVPALPPVMDLAAAADIRYLTVEQGMKSSSARPMLEDSRGNLWFAVRGGVSKYDGSSFTHYTTEEGLHFNYFSSMLEDSRGNLWFGGFGGVSSYNGVDFTHFLTDNRVTSILEDSSGNLWLGTNSGITYFEPEANNGKGRFIHFFIEEKGVRYGAEGLIEDSQGNIWFETVGERGFLAGVSRYQPGPNGSIGSFIRFTTDQGLSSNWIQSILEDSRGDVWFATVGSGVCRYDRDANGGQGSFTHFTAKEGLVDEVAANRFSINNESVFDSGEKSGGQIVTSIWEDKYGHIWFGTYSGISCYDADANNGRGSFTHYTEAEGLSDNRISSILEDSQGNLWFGTREGGVNRFNRNGLVFYNREEAIYSNQIVSVLEDSRSHLWIGFNDVSVKRYDPGSNNGQGTFAEIFTEGKGYQPLLEDSSGNLWFGSYEPSNPFTGMPFTGMVRYTPGNGTETEGYLTQFSVETGLKNSPTRTMLEDSRGNLWFGTWNGGAVRYEPDPDRAGTIGKFTHITVEEGLGDNRVNAILEDRRGSLWFGTWAGAVRFDPDPGQEEISGTFTHFTEKEGLSNNVVMSIMEDSRGNIWFGTRGGGASCYDPDASGGQGHFTNFTTENGLSENEVRGIQEDKQHRIWISTRSHTAVLVPPYPETSMNNITEPNDYRLITLERADGLRSLWNNSGGYIDHHNRMWWGYSTGMSMLDLNRFDLSAAPTQIRLRNIDVIQTFVDYRRLLSDSTYQDSLAFGEALAESFDSVAPFCNYPHVMELPHQLNHLTFYFSAIDWASPQRLQYSYILEGQDEKWSPLTTESKADYRNLSPGDYTFKIKAVGAAGLWSEVYDYPFRIRPPWYAAWWTFLIYGALTLYLLYHLYRFLLSRQLERSEIVRLQELDAFKTRLYTNITHEFRTPLTIILGMVRQVRDDPKKWFDEGLQMIGRNGRQLLNLVNQMLDLSKLDKGKLQLKPQPGEMVSFLRYLIQSFESLAADKGIQLHFLNKMGQLHMEFDPDQLTKVVGNLLSNAVKFTPEGGHVYVTVQNQQETLELSVRDTGPGLAAEELPRIFDRFYQVDDSATRRVAGAGVGLALAKELVQLMGGKIRVQSTPGVGTDFSVLLPVKRSVPEEVVHMGPKLQKRKEVMPEPDISSLLTDQIPPAEMAPSPVPEAEVAISSPPGTDKSDRPVILLIEDDRDVLTYLASCLEADYQLEFARDGQAGIHRALEIVPDMIVSDIMMPEKDGYEVCAALKEDVRTSHIPIILLTAKADQGSRITGLKSGADAYLTKPFDKEELEVRLKKLLELRQQLQARFGQHYLDLKPGEQYTSKEEQFLLDLRETVEKHLSDENFGIAELCWEMGMSRSQLYNKIKALTGEPASLYIRAIRLEKAKRLLLHTDLNISEIAYESGFRTPVYFSQAFSEVVGVSPSDFRKNKGELLQ